MLCGGKCPTNLFFFPQNNKNPAPQHCLTVMSAASTDKVPPALFWREKQLCSDRVVPAVHIPSLHCHLGCRGPPHQLPVAARSQLFP